ncbi:hypothetical protein CEQ90_03845 [Lewinellaceae bacterium SD302]|nr:hypothetical protein CEQ90_03845 [Lewinellaceae bacterium SD302]
MKTNFTLGLILFLLGQLPAQLINEFEPNPVGGDPTNQNVELKGTPGAGFAGMLVSIESDLANIGTVDRLQAISGTFDANGLLVVSVPDLENPSFTLVLTGNDATVVVGDDLDLDNDGSIDNPGDLGTILDAIGIPDEADDADNGVYGVDLGGADFLFTGDEPKLVFRDGVNNQWYAINDPDGGTVFDLAATMVDPMDFDIDPLAGSTFGSTNPTTGLAPVTLVDFKVAKLTRSVKLNWSTINETGNDYFAVERSTDNGRTFSEIGRSKGSGNSRDFNAYEFVDENPFRGTSFYRLRQVDFDGTKTFYGPLSVQFGEASTTVTVFPNPAYETISLRGLAGVVEEIEIFNALGRRVKTVSNTATKSAGTSIDISGLHRGVYLVKYRSGSERGALRFIKR